MAPSCRTRQVVEAQVHELDELHEGDSRHSEFTIDEAQMLAFAQLSGDRNPVHLDEDFARSKGFEGRVVYGGLLVAQVSQLIGMQLPGRDALWNGLRIDFLAPLYVGVPARVEAVVSHVSEATGTLQLKLRIEANGERVAKGSASVSVRP
jgi:acyl dehydratase